MQIYDDFKGPHKRTRSTTDPRAEKGIAKQDEVIVQRNGCRSSSLTKISGHLSNCRVPFTPRFPNLANSANSFCMNLGCSSSSSQGTVSKSGNDSCSVNSKVPFRGKRRPMQPKNSECNTDRSTRVTKLSPALVGQEDDCVTPPRQSRESKKMTKSFGGDTLTPRQRNLRRFIAERRNRQLMDVEENDNDIGQEDVEGYKSTQSILAPPTISVQAPPTIDSSVSIDMGNLVLKMDATIESHCEEECGRLPKSLVGRDICVPLTPDVDASVGSGKSDASSIATVETDFHAHNMEGNDRLNGTRLPVLYLGSYQQSLWLDFGDERSNIVGRPRSLPFQLRAPDDTVIDSSSLSSSVYVDDNFCIVKVEKVPVKKGFSLNFLNPCEENMEENREDESEDPNRFSIDSGGSRMLTLTWQPVESGNMREVVYLKLRRGRVRIIAHGQARVAKKKNMTKVQTKEGSRQMQTKIQPVIREHLSIALKNDKNFSLGFNSSSKDYLPTNSVKTSSASVKSVKSTRSTKSTRSMQSTRSTRSTRSTSSFSSIRARSGCNDAWADRQCSTYQGWLNFLFRHRDGMPEADSLLELDSVPPHEQHTLRILLLQRQGAHTRQLAISFYRGPEMLAIRKAIDMDVDSKRLCFRTDPYVLANVSLRSRLISILLSYSVPWLRLGLETIFAETITIHSSSKPLETQEPNETKRTISKKTTMKALLKRFIIERVLSDPDIKAKYTRGKCMMPSGRFEVMYKKELSRVVLKRILLLVVFLDHAKTKNIIYPSPCLFNTNGVAKSSKDFLALLCKDYIHGIGNLSKHLTLIGISVFYNQNHIEELDYSITNMAVDLRDGTRLAKLAEILSGDSESSILGKLRLPAVSRLQKVHNIKVVLSAFSNLPIPNIEFVQPDHIVDSHRPQVLQFLWSIISHFNLSILLDTAKLKLEIDAVHRTNMCKISQNKNMCQCDPSNYIQNDDGELNDELCILLLRWCRAVCWSYGIEVNNFSESFLDGKAICCLVHFYHPSIIQHNEILPTVSDMFDHEVNVDAIKKDPLLQQRYRHALENERHNSALANMRIKEIGGIPHVLPISDSTTLPDERSTIISIAYLCSRLIESSTEILSTILIQRAFRKYQNKKLSKQKQNAVMLISLYWIKYKSAQLEMREKIVKYEAASRIQAVYRGWRLKEYLCSACNHVIVIQKVWRGFLWRRHYRIFIRSAILIQNTVRRKLATLVVSRRKDMIIQIQCIARRYCAICKRILIQTEMDYKYRLNAAATTCQAYARQKIVMKHLYEELVRVQAATAVQRAYRNYIDRSLNLRQNENVKQIQAFYRGYKIRRKSGKMIESIVAIQTVWRVFSTQVFYKIKISNILVIQSLVRRQIGRTVLDKRKDAIEKIQRTCRAYLALRAYEIDLSKYESSRKIQSTYRCYKMSSNFAKAKKRACLIQAMYKGILVRNALRTLSSTAVLIQTIWRASSARMQFKIDLSDIIMLQSVVRKRLAVTSIAERKAAIMQIQCAFRKWIAVRTAYSMKEALNQEKLTYEAAIVCQTYARRWIVYLASNQQNLCNNAASLIQRNWRCNKHISTHKLVAVKIIQKSLRHWIARRKITRVSVRRNHNYVSRMLRSLRLSSTRSVERRHKAATIIQKYWRGYLANVDYMITIFAIIRLQTFVRTKITRISYLGSIKMIKLIQSHMRGSIARTYVNKQLKCGSTIQCWWENRIDSIKCHLAVTEIQRLGRGCLVRADLQTQHKSASNIQRSWRGYHANTNYMLVMLSMIKIQTCWRQVLAKKKLFILADQSIMQRTDLLLQSKTESVSALRSVYPLFLRHSNLWMVVEIQKRWRGLFPRKKFQQVRAGFTSLQSLFRGRRIRQSSSRKLSNVAKRIAIANIDAEADPKMVLGFRTSRALQVLQRSQRLTEIMDAIRTLEISTRLSPNCCVRFTVAGAHKILYNLIRSCNRSLPHVDLLQFILMTLSNVSNHPALISKIATSESIDILLDLIQMFRDKDTIFCLASTLLELLALSEDMFKVQCQKRENLKRISGVHNLCLKKLSLIRNKSTGSKKSSFNKGISKEMSAGIRALKHILLKTSTYGKGGV